MSGKIKAVILDWAGTTVDFGSLAPVAAFRTAFERTGLSPDDGLIRKYMGLPKKDHIRHMLFDNALTQKFTEVNGRNPGEADVESIYADFEPALFEVLKDYASPLPGVVSTVARLREAGIKIGSTTGYTREMMEVLLPVAKANGYEPDCLVCPGEVGGAGRPFPYMLWENLRRLGVENIDSVLKIGDTAADIAEGKNAGCVSAGVIYGSNMMGVSRGEYESEDETGRSRLEGSARDAYVKAGADKIIGSFPDILDLIESID
jgi:phosphonoacetaldehyde hydrolase